MRNRIGLSALFLVLVAVGIPKVFADNLPKTPSVTQCSISPKDLPSSGGLVTVQIHIVSLNGVYSGVTAVTDNVSKSGEHLFTGALSRVNGSPQDGDWVGDFQVSSSHTPGNYRLSLFPISDVQGVNDGYIHCDSEIVNLGVPKLGSSSNSSTVFPAPAPTVTVTAQPVPAPTITVTAQPVPAPTVTVTAQPSPTSSGITQSTTTSNANIALLTAKINLLQAQLKRICSAKVKPKGC